MKSYPFTPELLDALPEPLAELFRGLEDTLLDEVCSRLNLSDQLNEVSVQAIRALRSHGISFEEVEKAISKTANVAMDDLNKLFDDVVKRNQEYYTELIDIAKVTAPEVIVGIEDIEAIRRQTEDAFKNITQSMGFLVDNGKTPLPAAKAYQWALDSAELQIQSGAISYNEAISRAVKALADSGIKVVSYESGHVDHVDVAVRRAVMTGITQLCEKYTEQSAEYLDTDLFEVSAHQGARDKGVGYENHKSWQGKVYATNDDHPEYPNIYEVCGFGQGGGLGGWNCRHRRWTFVEGVSERTYTDEQLAEIDPPPIEYQGRMYTAYEATQKQRQIERTIRKVQHQRNASKASGLKDEAQNANIRLRRLRAEYRAFSKAAGLPEQWDRTKVLYT